MIGGQGATERFLIDLAVPPVMDLPGAREASARSKLVGRALAIVTAWEHNPERGFERLAEAVATYHAEMASC